MVDGTFGNTWRKVNLHVPVAPSLLVQSWVQDTYRQLTDMRGWGWRTVQSQLTFLAARTLATVNVTLGSKTVTSAGLFVSTDQNRTFRVGTYPMYQIARYVDANTLELVLEYQGLSSGAVDAQILDAYVTMPVGFRRFMVIVDPINQRMVPWWCTQEELDLLDPTRTSADTVPRMLAASGMSQLPDSAGQTQYELWPKPSAAGSLQTYLVNGPRPLQDTDFFWGVLRDRTDVLIEGALARAAAWPGTTEKPNPYFNLGLATYHQKRFASLALQLDLRDDDQFQQSWSTIPWQRWSAWAWAYDTRLLQATDATIADYAGSGYWGGLGW